MDGKKEQGPPFVFTPMTREEFRAKHGREPILNRRFRSDEFDAYIQTEEGQDEFTVGLTEAWERKQRRVAELN